MHWFFSFSKHFFTLSFRHLTEVPTSTFSEILVKSTPENQKMKPVMFNTSKRNNWITDSSFMKVRGGFGRRLTASFKKTKTNQKKRMFSKATTFLTAFFIFLVMFTFQEDCSFSQLGFTIWLFVWKVLCILAKGMLFQIMSYKLMAEHGPVIGKKNFLPGKGCSFIWSLFIQTLHSDPLLGILRFVNLSISQNSSCERLLCFTNRKALEKYHICI